MTHETVNQRTWDNMARNGSLFAKVATDEECARPLQTLDSRGWLPTDVTGMKVLCLAAGGGWQGVLYAVAGADVTVVDLSAEMLLRDQQQAAARNLSLRTLQCSMTHLAPLESSSFDIVHQPVSTCYVADVESVFREVARVLRPGGIYVSQHKQPTSLQLHAFHRSGHYELAIPYYHAGPLPPVADASYREPGTVEFLHRWEQLVGGMCRAGLMIEDLVEPRRGDPTAVPGQYQHRGMYTPPYVRVKARKLSNVKQGVPANSLWTPVER